MAEQTVIFLHIPKTAGTTLHYIIDQNYPKANNYGCEYGNVTAREAFFNLPDERKKQIDIFWGHAPYGVHQHFPNPTSYFTLLRDPVERVISHYHFVRADPEQFPPNERIALENMSMHDILEARLIVDIENMQTRFLAGLPHLFPLDDHNETHLAQAKENLRHNIAVFGLVERFDETLLLLKKAFGWRNVYYTRQNTGRERAPISAETRALIEKQNWLDVQLYQYATQLFEERMAAQEETFSAELRSFQTRNKYIYGPLLNAYWRVRRIPFRTLIKQRVQHRTTS